MEDIISNILSILNVDSGNQGENVPVMNSDSPYIDFEVINRETGR